MSIATYYDILRVSPEASPQGVRSAYRTLAQKYHPDKLPGNSDAVRVMAMLNEAYAVLSDPTRRARYDRSIASAAAHAASARRTMPQPELREAAWPWWLLFATFAFAFLAIGTAAWRMAFPAVAMPSAQSHAAKPLVTPPVRLTKN